MTTTTLPDGLRIASGDEPGWTYHGLWVTDAPPIQPATAPTSTVVCPLGCGSQISAQQDEIHYCVVHTKVSNFPKKGCKTTTHREYVGTWDGEAMFYGACYDEVERQLRPWVEELQSSGLTRSASELDGGMPEYVELIDPEVAPEAKPNGTKPCERCGSPWAENRDLVIQTDNGERNPVTFRLCEPCYRDGEQIEPIRDVDAFLAGPYHGRPEATTWTQEPTRLGEWTQPEQTDPDTPAALTAASCTICGGPHRPTQCPEVGALLMRDRSIFEELPSLRRAHQTAMADGHYITANGLMDRGACWAEIYVTSLDEPVWVGA